MSKILYVSTAIDISGAEKSLVSLVESLRCKYDIKVACPTDSKLWSYTRDRGIFCYGLCQYKFLISKPLRSIINSISGSWKLIRVIYGTEIEIIHANNIYALMISMLPSFVLRKKLIWHCRDIIRHSWITRICSLFCSKIIAISKSVSEKLISCGIGLDKIEIVYNGVEEKSIKASFVDDSCEKKDVFIFGNVGQFVPWKNQIAFLNAAIKLSETCENVEYWLIGDDVFGNDSVYKASLLEKIKQVPGKCKFRYLGWREDMESIWEQIDCLVHTAKDEPFGRVVVEAMANRVPVIAIDSGGPSEIIEHNRTGVLVPSDSPEVLVEAMKKMVTGTSFYHKISDTAYENVFLRFSASKTAKQVSQIYQQILS